MDNTVKSQLPLKTGLKYVEAMKRLNGSASWTLVSYQVNASGLMLEWYGRCGTSINDLEIDKRSIGELLVLFVNIGRALAYVHSKEILLVALSLEHIHMDLSGAIVFTDFSDCIFTDVRERSDFYLNEGSKYDASPEAVFEPWRVSVQSDIFSLGMVFKKIIEDSPVTIKMYFSEIIKTMTNIIPHKRFETCEQVINKLLENER